MVIFSGMSDGSVDRSAFAAYESGTPLIGLVQRKGETLVGGVLSFFMQRNKDSSHRRRQ